ncbi:hypothetical protein Q5424_25950 [Conexibacter sp. JD483]|uniref:hypothetical protein n=1 Tax=unclassified Conexibacter TaxID=2627773 RepID=UPI0027281C91|nr:MULTISPECIES: hypothetical protein [unclassified Conexibacter]MDO8189432.1 hypothetical protein [Conexibacter sp. CPCC 205706]MDO8199170.1 hypothetical protein [Conexibacter sp. CPCC 205762]MDR9372569.1 hypothetical protein [Conexibacter sp. JD483]
MLPRGTLTLDDGRELRIEIVRSSGDGRALLVREAGEQFGRSRGAPRTEAIERSAALTRASREELPDEPVTPAAARAVAAAIGAAEFPQPPGVDSAGSIDWEGRCGGDAITLGELHELLELTAARDWLRFAARHRLTAEQRLILSDVPRWPRLRDQPLGDEVAAAVAALLADGDAEPIRALADRLSRPAACR